MADRGSGKASDPLHWKCDSLLFDPRSAVPDGGGGRVGGKKRREEERTGKKTKERRNDISSSEPRAERSAYLLGQEIQGFRGVEGLESCVLHWGCVGTEGLGL